MRNVSFAIDRMSARSVSSQRPATCDLRPAACSPRILTPDSRILCPFPNATLSGDVPVPLLVALGGAIGSVARYLLAGFVHRFASPYFPFGTFVVNIVGCLVFGTIFALSEQRFVIGPPLRAFLLIGVLGGFTTFSSFTFETFQLLRDGELMLAGANAVGQIVVGLVAFWLGTIVVRAL
jgi:CrcB protein